MKPDSMSGSLCSTAATASSLSSCEGARGRRLPRVLTTSAVCNQQRMAGEHCADRLSSSGQSSTQVLPVKGAGAWGKKVRVHLRNDLPRFLVRGTLLRRLPSASGTRDDCAAALPPINLCMPAIGNTASWPPSDPITMQKARCCRCGQQRRYASRHFAGLTVRNVCTELSRKGVHECGTKVSRNFVLRLRYSTVLFEWTHSGVQYASHTTLVQHHPKPITNVPATDSALAIVAYTGHPCVACST